MKKISLLLLTFLCVCSLNAENYPYRSDVVWLTVPSHSDWLYETGEKAQVEVTVCRYGIPVEGEIDYRISGDVLPTEKEGRVALKNGRAVVQVGTRRTPGFRDIAFDLQLDGKTYTHHIKVGFSVDQIRPQVAMPSDFRRFWEDELAAMRRVPLEYERERAEELCTDKILCDLLKIRVDKTHYVYAYLTYPRDAQKGGCPAVISPPGAGIKTIKEPLRHKYYAEKGFLRLELEIHGLDPRLSASTFADITRAFGGKDNGYLCNGIESRERYYLKHVYLAMARAVDVMASLPEWDGRTMAFQGGSQGGALSIVGAALDERVTHCIVNHPALADMAAATAGEDITEGYPHFSKLPVELTADMQRTLQYYDVVNFARLLTCPVRMTWGYNDNTCPPTTSYAVWNVISAPKTALLTPINEHWTSEETEYAHCAWLLEQIGK